MIRAKVESRKFRLRRKWFHKLRKGSLLLVSCLKRYVSPREGELLQAISSFRSQNEPGYDAIFNYNTEKHRVSISPLTLSRLQ